MREECAENVRLLQVELVSSVLQYESDICAIQWQPLIDCLLHRVLLGLSEILESPDFRVVLGEILEGVPVAVLDGFYATILEKALAGLHI